jgi:hypothetical protein
MTTVSTTPTAVIVSAPPCRVLIPNSTTAPIKVANNAAMINPSVIQPGATFAQDYLSNDPVVTWCVTVPYGSASITASLSAPVSPLPVAGGAAHGTTAGALPTVAMVSGTAQQFDKLNDRNVAMPITSTGSAGTVAVALSPDGVTFSTLATLTTVASAGQVTLLNQPVPAGWWLKLTATNATLGTATYF